MHEQCLGYLLLSPKERSEIWLPFIPRSEHLGWDFLPLVPEPDSSPGCEMMGGAQGTGTGVPGEGGAARAGRGRLVLIVLSINESGGKHLGLLCWARGEWEAEMPPFLEIWP